MFDKVYDMLVSFLGESKQGRYSKDITQYQFNCPCCADENGGIPDGKYNLEVQLSSTDGLRYHCWKCGDSDGTKGNLGNLIKRYGGYSLYHEYKDEINALMETRLYDLHLYSGFSVSIEEKTLYLPDTFTKININSCKDRTLLAYLKKRKITQDIIDKFNIGFTTWDEKKKTWRKRLIIPSYNSFGNLNYYVGRDYTGKALTKYRNCDYDKKKIVFQESLIDWDSTIYLCEGALDCIYVPNALSLLGKKLDTESEIYEILIKKANANVVVVLDGDTKNSETTKICSLLDNGRLSGKVGYILLSEINNGCKDFGEIYEKFGKKGIIDVLRQIKPYTGKIV